jgi:hypothetical protein
MLGILDGPRAKEDHPALGAPRWPHGRRTAPAPRLAATHGPGLLLALAIATVASLLAQVVPPAGGAVIAIVLGITVHARLGLSARYAPGVRVAAQRLLQVAIVLLGAGLSLLFQWLGSAAACDGAHAWCCGRTR